MRFLLLIAQFLLTVFLAQAQTNSYGKDLPAFRQMVQKTPSYRAQIKGKKLAAYNELYNRLKNDSVDDPGSFKYFHNLSQLLFPLRDNHLGFFQIPIYSKYALTHSIDSIQQTREFREYASVVLNIDSLKEVLENAPDDSISGIFYYDTLYTVGVYENGRDEYVGMVLESNSPLWMKNQVALYLYKFGLNKYKAIYAHPLNKGLLYYPLEKYGNYSLLNSTFYNANNVVYTKKPDQTDHANPDLSSSKFLLKDINSNIQYLLIRSFQADPKTSAESKLFYDSIKTALKAPNVVLDLRYNQGGAKKEMKKYLSLLKHYASKGKLFVLINNSTLSQAEIFTLRLRKLKNVTVLGQQTKGMLTYGSNTGKQLRFGSGRFLFYPTDMRGKSALLKFEDQGIDPEITLHSKKDWILQTIDIINSE